VSRTSLIYHFESDVSDLAGKKSDSLDTVIQSVFSQNPQGIEGEVVLVGSSADLGDFRIRIVDREFSARLR
jgi:hypothetical protein